MLVNTPPMGWNSWNTFGANISEALVRETADKFIELGLDKVGYNYVVIDDCWSEKYRDYETGRLVASHEKFPGGMKALADYIHSKGLKFGMYSCAGVRTCADYPSSYDHEFLDAKTFAEWGVDFLKYDFCYNPWRGKNMGKYLYLRMGNALRACGRDILFSACNWGTEDVWSWIRSTGAHMYRSTGDVNDSFGSFAKIALSQMDKYCYSAQQCFNDMDMLTVGMFGKGNVALQKVDSMSEEDRKIWYRNYVNEFTLWCLMGSPLMLGCDIRKLSEPAMADILALVKNKDLIAINQDPECRPAFRCSSRSSCESSPCESAEVLARQLADGTMAVGFFNFTEKPQWTSVFHEHLGFPVTSGVKLNFRDVFTGEEHCNNREVTDITLEPYESKLFIVSVR